LAQLKKANVIQYFPVIENLREKFFGEGMLQIIIVRVRIRLLFIRIIILVIFMQNILLIPQRAFACWLFVFPLSSTVIAELIITSTKEIKQLEWMGTKMP
jgi:hypothetical protein